MLRKLLIILILAVFLFGSASFAIEKQQQKKQPIEKPKQEVKSPDKKTPDIKADVNRNNEPTGKDYDNFIDENKNGIDDRAEGKSKESKKNKPEKTRKKTKEPSR